MIAPAPARPLHHLVGTIPRDVTKPLSRAAPLSRSFCTTHAAASSSFALIAFQLPAPANNGKCVCSGIGRTGRGVRPSRRALPAPTQFFTLALAWLCDKNGGPAFSPHTPPFPPKLLLCCVASPQCVGGASRGAFGGTLFCGDLQLPYDTKIPPQTACAQSPRPLRTGTLHSVARAVCCQPLLLSARPL